MTMSLDILLVVKNRDLIEVLKSFSPDYRFRGVEEVRDPHHRGRA
jgi:hypothetical protein